MIFFIVNILDFFWCDYLIMWINYYLWNVLILKEFMMIFFWGFKVKVLIVLILGSVWG